MSMLNQSGEEPVECPLCMEPLEVDDLNFFPCTCGYQICRFCWHRIRTDENGLCPACRKAYPEDPADFKPLSKEDFARIKAEKRQKNQQKKQKITENRKSLGNVRVVQKNLVFVLGLPTRLADAEVLKRHEYFGKFGKILKVVVNQSTSYAGNQGPCASAYVTYSRSEDALRAIQAVNNISVDGRVIKTSLGTTKYCSHFMKNQPCPKPDCMYLHEMGDPEASFTKEEMQQGKHQEFEKKLHEQLINNTPQQGQQQSGQQNRKPSPSPPSVQLSNSLNQYSSSSNSSPTLTGNSNSNNNNNISNSNNSNNTSNVSNRNSPTLLTSSTLGTCNSIISAAAATHQQIQSAVTNSPNDDWPVLRAYSPTISPNHTATTDSTANNSKDLRNKSNSNGGGAFTILDQMSSSGENSTFEISSKKTTQHSSSKHNKNKRYTPSNESRKFEENDSTMLLDAASSAPAAVVADIQELSQQQQQQQQRSEILSPVLAANQCSRSPELAQYTAVRLGSSETQDLQQVTTDGSQQKLRTSPSASITSTATATVFDNVDTNSFFSSRNLSSCILNNTAHSTSQSEWLLNGEPHMPDVLPPVHSSEDWQAAFGFATGHSEELAENSVYRNDDDLGFDPFTETQKALAEMIENEKQNCGYYYHHHHHHHHNHHNYHHHHHNNNNNNNSSSNHNHHLHHNNSSNNNNNNNNSNTFSNSNTNSSVYQKRFIAVQQNNKLANCSKLLDELRLGSVIPPRTHVPPPGFSNTPNHMNAFGLGIPRTGNKLLPFTQQTLTAFQQHTTPAVWDWPSIDPAIVSATAQHCDLYTTQPPPGFTLTPTIDSKYVFNNYI